LKSLYYDTRSEKHQIKMSVRNWLEIVELSGWRGGFISGSCEKENRL